MTNQYHLVTRTNPETGNDVTCKSCGDKIGGGVFWLEVFNPEARYDSYEPDYWPICSLCAAEEAPDLAKLVFLAEAAASYANGGVSTHISEAMKKRENDPEWLKKKLLASCNELARRGCHLPLVEFVEEEIARAIESGNVKTMQHAKRLFEDRTHQWMNQEGLDILGRL
ncbi:MAG: hypothetical protein QGD90_10975 [Candidatus Hydrogenedentes bacterium]|nr:hypothetical protein [Candidatus Hydrogenedentota bacterium]